MASPTIAANTYSGYDSAGATTTTAISVAVGDIVLVFHTWQTNSTAPTLSDSQSGSFSQVGSFARQSGAIVSSGSWSRCSARLITEASGSYTVTATKTDGYTSLFVVVVAGGDFASLQEASTYDTSNPWSQSITTTADEARLVGFSSPEGQSALTTFVLTEVGFTELHKELSFDFWQGGSAHREAATAGSYTFTVSTTGATVASASIGVVAIYPASEPSVEFNPGTVYRRVGGVFVPVTAYHRAGGTFAPATPYEATTP